MSTKRARESSDSAAVRRVCSQRTAAREARARIAAFAVAYSKDVACDDGDRTETASETEPDLAPDCPRPLPVPLVHERWTSPILPPPFGWKNAPWRTPLPEADASGSADDASSGLLRLARATDWVPSPCTADLCDAPPPTDTSVLRLSVADAVRVVEALKHRPDVTKAVRACLASGQSLCVQLRAPVARDTTSLAAS